jgi:hypothetical protein
MQRKVVSPTFSPQLDRDDREKRQRHGVRRSRRCSLAVLDKLCFLPCEEYSDLKKAVGDYESSGGRVKPASTSN